MYFPCNGFPVLKDLTLLFRAYNNLNVKTVSIIMPSVINFFPSGVNATEMLILPPAQKFGSRSYPKGWGISPSMV
jgi:hypothetical protein